MKIMIVDDHREIRRLLMSTLGNLASEFVECSDGAEAVAAWSQHHPDWTVMDVAMKPMDGLEATRRIKARFADARILILTQHDSPPIRQAALDAGACAFVAKDHLEQIIAMLAVRPQDRPNPGESA
jgi:CheY-like chemotaxis protein